MSQPALRDPLQDGHKPFQSLVPPSRLKGRRVEVRRKPRGAYAIDRPGRVALRRLRQGLDLSQHALALEAGVSVGTVQRVESGVSKRLTFESRARLAVALRIAMKHLEELFDLPIEVGDGEAAA